jgi:ABC-type transport system involved in resistance to organic solvents, auxiliary component
MSLFYADAMQEYSGETLEIANIQDAGKKGFVVVSRVTNRQPPLTINWQVKPSSTGLKVIDLQVEGVSMLITWRNEFSSIINRNGGTLAAASKDLEQRIGQF